MPEGFNCSLLFCIACKSIGHVSSFSLRKLLSLLNRNLINLCGMGRMLRLLMQKWLKWLGLMFVSLRRGWFGVEEAWSLESNFYA
jgi:hypothetical protein